MTRTEGARLAVKVGTQLRAAGYTPEITGHLRLGLNEFKRPFLLVAPPDRMGLSKMFTTLNDTPNLLIAYNGQQVTLVPAALDYFGAFQILYTGPWGFVLYVAKRAANMGYHWLSKGARPGLYQRQTLLAAKSEEQIFDVLRFEHERRSLVFRSRFRQNWWHARDGAGAEPAQMDPDGGLPDLGILSI